MEELLKLLEDEEKDEGVKIGYKIFCSRSNDSFWKCKYGDNDYDGMISDLINEGTLSKDELKELIEDKYVFRDSCCDTYYAIAVY